MRHKSEKPQYKQSLESGVGSRQSERIKQIVGASLLTLLASSCANAKFEPSNPAREVVTTVESNTTSPSPSHSDQLPITANTPGAGTQKFLHPLVNICGSIPTIVVDEVMGTNNASCTHYFRPGGGEGYGDFEQADWSYPNQGSAAIYNDRGIFATIDSDPDGSMFSQFIANNGDAVATTVSGDKALWSNSEQDLIISVGTYALDVTGIWLGTQQDQYAPDHERKIVEIAGAIVKDGFAQ
ncbi:MAG TPA: hypothetical protein VNE40_02785 [Candidatus Dormibacteraeota bacterium]|nr:hypothetical protein [Candidatus Dormibacteraeota bacterium]